MPESISHQVVLARFIEGTPTPEDFALQEVPWPTLPQGQVRVEVQWMSVDPGTRTRLGGTDSYGPAVQLGQVIPAAGVGTVVESTHPSYPVGTEVAGAFGWCSHAVSTGRGLRRLEAFESPASTALGIYGLPGLTAYIGLLDLGAPEKGQTVLVSSAAGAVGSLAGQIAVQVGARAVGIAGGPAKCRALTEELGFAAAIDYRATADLASAIRAACPEGVHVFFDNVGGATLDAALVCMAQRGRIVVSGAVGDYNSPVEARVGIKNGTAFITQRLRMQGFVVLDHADRFGEARTALAGWVERGVVTLREEVSEGLETAPRAFVDLLAGRGMGRHIVHRRSR